ncbi:SDR family oxidoreductase [Myxococcota bacterium]|nr:SDR family oxidoreductase [Myxococcota bacterium]
MSQSRASERSEATGNTGRLAGKAALVTGAARGTGAAIARLFASEGARVMLADVRDEAGRAVADEIGEAAVYRHLDVRLEADWAAAVEAALEAFGRLDILVNNAARLIIKAMVDTTPEEVLELVEVNQLGPYLGIRAVTPSMRAAGGGSIVNVCSSDGVKGMNGVTAYASTKWALRGITKSAAMELARHAIRVNAVCPEAGNFEMSAPFLGEGVDPQQAAEANAGQLLRPPPGYSMHDHILDVARTVLFLASDECPTATAADFVVDGGLTAGYIQPGIPGAD